MLFTNHWLFRLWNQTHHEHFIYENIVYRVYNQMNNICVAPFGSSYVDADNWSSNIITVYKHISELIYLFKSPPLRAMHQKRKNIEKMISGTCKVIIKIYSLEYQFVFDISVKWKWTSSAIPFLLYGYNRQSIWLWTGIP